MANCKTTSDLLSEIPPTLAEFILFFKASIGLKPDTTMAGYSPAIRVTMINKLDRYRQVCQLNRLIFSVIEDTCLILGRHNSAIPIASKMETRTTIAVSPKICHSKFPVSYTHLTLPTKRIV